MQIRSRRKNKAQINIVPLIDVITVLIFFFLLTMQFKKESSINISPPEASHSQEQDIKEKEIFLIEISKDQEYFIENKKVSIKYLEEKINTLAKENPQIQIVLKADKLSHIDNFVKIYDLISENQKLSKLKLIVEKNN